MSNKKLLLIMRHPPFVSNNNKDSLDIALACSAFDIPVSILFTEDAILQITHAPHTELLDQKNLANTFKALEMYDIDDCYVVAEDLSRFNTEINDLVIRCQKLNRKHLSSFIQAFDTVINL